MDPAGEARTHEGSARGGPSREREASNGLGCGPRVAAVGGGHGLAASLRAARRYAGELAAIVAVADALCDAPSLDALPPEQVAVVGREPIERVLADLDEALAEVERRLNV